MGRMRPKEVLHGTMLKPTQGCSSVQFQPVFAAYLAPHTRIDIGFSSHFVRDFQTRLYFTVELIDPLFEILAHRRISVA
jgi:hypothetical protein